MRCSRGARPAGLGRQRSGGLAGTQLGAEAEHEKIMLRRIGGLGRGDFCPGGEAEDRTTGGEGVVGLIRLHRIWRVLVFENPPETEPQRP